jgi:hypothetical protein
VTVLRIEAGFPAGVQPTDLSFGDLHVSGDLGTWATGPGTRIQLVVSLVGMAGELLGWCRGGAATATLTSFEAKRLLTLRERPDGIEVSGPDGPLHLAATRREVCLAFHTGVFGLIDAYPDLGWTVAEDDFWTVMADFRVQCLPGLVLED